MKKVSLYKILVFIGLAFLLFVNNGKVSLWDEDEAAYAGFAKHMIESKNYVVPQFVWSDVHRKPPLHFWLIAAAYKIFGVNEFAVRFFVALSLLGVYLLIYFMGKHFIPERAAFYSAIILGTSFFAPLLGKVAVTDGLLLFFHTLAGFSLLYVLEERKWIYVFWFYLAVTFGLLVKGPPILIFTGFFVILLYIFHPKRKNLLILHPWFFGWIALAPLLIWGYLAWKQNPGFVKWLIDWYILKRIHGEVFGQTGPIGYYIVTIVLFFSAYFAFFPAAFKNAISSFWKKEKKQWFLIGAWMVSGWLFYEFLKSKLPTYVIAAYPGFAMALGYQIYLYETKQADYQLTKWSSIFHFIIALSIGLGLVIFGQKIMDYTTYTQTLGIVTIYIMLTSYALVTIWVKDYKRTAKALMFNSWLFLFFTFTLLLPRLDNLRNATYRVAVYIGKYSKPQSTVVVANDYAQPPSLPFYLQRHCPKDKFIYTENFSTIVKLYNNNQYCVLILNKKLAERFEKKYPFAYVKHIESLAVDRKGNLDYYIIIKNQASE